MIAKLLTDLHERGVEVRVESGALRVSGRKGAYTPAVKAQLIQLKPEIVRHLEAQAETAEQIYERDERAWAVEYGSALAYAMGYSEEQVEQAAAALRQRPARAPFSIGPEVIVVPVGDGLTVRIQRQRRSAAALLPP